MTEVSVARTSWEQFSPRQRWTFLAVLFLVGTSSSMDRGILAVLLAPLKQEFALSDTMVGLLGGAPFGLCYALSSLPLARLADRRSRKLVLVLSIFSWSIMTAFCGLAPSLMLLVLARMGVGLAEGGAVAPSHALIADYFPPARRGIALAIFTASGTLALLVASGLGGWIAQTYGWREAFLAMAGLSVPIALLTLLVLREPERAKPDDRKSEQPSLTADLKALVAKKAFSATLLASLFYTALPFGVILFVPLYLTRGLGLSLAEAGTLFGLVTAAGAVIGSLLGGYIGDFVRRFGDAWLLKAPALVLMIDMAVAIASLMVHRVELFLALHAVNTALLYAVSPILFATVQHLCGSTRRATATAMLFVVLNAIGITLPPLLLGALSDAYSGWLGEDALRYAMMTMCLALAPAALSLWWGAKHVSAGHEE